MTTAAQHSRKIQNLIAIMSIVVMGVLLYGATLRGVYGNPTPADFEKKLDQSTMPFELSPERGRFTHLVALGNYHQYALTPELAKAAYPDVGEYQGKLYSFFAPGLPFLALPAYSLGFQFNLSQVFTFAFISLVSILGLIFLYKIAREIFNLPVWVALVTVFVFAFGSTAWSYAITFYQHHVTTFFMLSSFYAVWKYKQGKRGAVWWAAFACVNYGLSIMIDYPNALLLLPIMVYLLASSLQLKKNNKEVKVSIRAELLVALLFLGLITGIHFNMNQRFFGAWYRLSGSLQDYQPLSAKPIAISPEQASFTVETYQKNVIGFFKEERLPQGFLTLIFSNDRGLLYYSPIFALSIFGIIWLCRRKLTAEVVIVLSLIAVNLFLYSSWGDPWGGWAYGPRYLIPSMALLSLMIGVFLTHTRYKFLSRILTLVLFMYSGAIALLGALTTNAVPPAPEASTLEGLSNYLLNFRFFMRGQSSSFAYNLFLSHYFSLQTFFLIVYLFLLAVIFTILFILPYNTYDN